MSRKLFGTDGIRGPANQGVMTPEIAFRIGAAVTYQASRRVKHAPRVVIGKDTRVSGYLFETSLAAGVCALGGRVMLSGPLPTPAIAHLTTSMRADAGVVISASHNPFEDNGIKIFASDGFKLPDEAELEIEQLIESDKLDKARPRGKNVGRAERLDDAPGRYVAFVKQTFPQDLTLEGMRIVVDAAHGAAYRVAPAILSELGAEVIAIGVRPDGQNINRRCGANHPENCAHEVVRKKAHLGICLDGDADRLIIGRRARPGGRRRRGDVAVRDALAARGQAQAAHAGDDRDVQPGPRARHRAREGQAAALRRRRPLRGRRDAQERPQLRRRAERPPDLPRPRDHRRRPGRRAAGAGHLGARAKERRRAVGDGHRARAAGADQRQVPDPQGARRDAAHAARHPRRGEEARRQRSRPGPLERHRGQAAHHDRRALAPIASSRWPTTSPPKPSATSPDRLHATDHDELAGETRRRVASVARTRSARRGIMRSKLAYLSGCLLALTLAPRSPAGACTPLSEFYFHPSVPTLVPFDGVVPFVDCNPEQYCREFGAPVVTDAATGEVLAGETVVTHVGADGGPARAYWKPAAPLRVGQRYQLAPTDPRFIQALPPSSFMAVENAPFDPRDATALPVSTSIQPLEKGIGVAHCCPPRCGVSCVYERVDVRPFLNVAIKPADVPLAAQWSYEVQFATSGAPDRKPLSERFAFATYYEPPEVRDRYCYTIVAQPLVGGPPVTMHEGCIENTLQGLGERDVSDTKILNFFEENCPGANDGLECRLLAPSDDLSGPLTASLILLSLVASRFRRSRRNAA